MERFQLSAATVTDSKTIFCATLWLSNMSQHSLFGHSRPSISEDIVRTRTVSSGQRRQRRYRPDKEDIVRTNIHWNYRLAWPWRQQSILLSQGFKDCDNIPSNQRSGDIAENVVIFIWAVTVPMMLNKSVSVLANHSGSLWSFLQKILSSQTDL